MTEIAEQQHHRYSASGSEGWMVCAGKIAMEQGIPDQTSRYADEGSAAHFLSAECLLNEKDPVDYQGMWINCYAHQGKAYQAFRGEADGIPDGAEITSEWEVDETMVNYVEQYVFSIREDAKDGQLFVEQRVEFGPMIGLGGAFGTADAIILSHDGKTLKLRDLKYGFKPVSSEENRQMMLYALGAIHEFDFMFDVSEIENVDLKIVQPRTSQTDQNWITSLDSLYAFAEEAKSKLADAEEALQKFNEQGGYTLEWMDDYLQPSEKGCMWCKAKATCPALAQECLTDMSVPVATSDGLPDLDSEMDAAINRIAEVDFDALVQMFSVAKKVRIWIDAVENRMMHDMLNGYKSPHFKLVKGRMGNRKWVSVADVEELLKNKYRIPVGDIYEKKLVSPTRLEKTLKEKKPKVWKLIETFIMREEGKISVAPMSDKRESFDPYGEALAKLPDLTDEISIDDLL